MKTYWIVLSLSLLTTVLALKFVLTWPDKNFRYIQCDVGQGDAILLTKGFAQILVDSGSSDQVITCLEEYIPFWDRHIDVLVATHSDKDHIGGFDEVLERYEVERFVWNEVQATTDEWLKLVSLLREHGILMVSARKISKIEVANMQIYILWPQRDNIKELLYQDKRVFEVDYHSSNGSDNKNTNENSIVSQLRYGEFTALLTGDITVEIENQLLAQQQNLKSLVLKVAHHGSKHSTSEEFLTEVEPLLATIGVGKNNYGHPASKVLEILDKHNVQILRTDTHGHIVIVSNGNEWWVE
ncbi:MAG: ComEC/Rec2 family competence protein [Patescibacteria group bacterium]|jgi:competence protein ComEC